MKESVVFDNKASFPLTVLYLKILFPLSCSLNMQLFYFVLKFVFLARMYIRKGFVLFLLYS